MDLSVPALALCSMLSAAENPAASTSSTAAAITIVVESSALAGMVSVPIVNSRRIDFSVSSFAGCSDSPNEPPPLKELVKGKLVPKKNTASVSAPAEIDLAIYMTYVNVSGGNSVSCENALRFRGEPGKTYKVSFTPPLGFHLVSCDIAIYEWEEGNVSPVPSAQKAVLINKGTWKGTELNICARPDMPKVSSPTN